MKKLRGIYAKPWLGYLGLRADATVVKTIIRAKSRLMFLKDGVVDSLNFITITPVPMKFWNLYINEV